MEVGRLGLGPWEPYGPLHRSVGGRSAREGEMARPAPRPAVREPVRARAQSTTRPARCTGPIPKPSIVSDASPEPANVPASLSHVQGEGESARAVMVDVSAKQPGRRVAVAGASVVDDCSRPDDASKSALREAFDPAKRVRLPLSLLLQGAGPRSVP